MVICFEFFFCVIFADRLFFFFFCEFRWCFANFSPLYALLSCNSHSFIRMNDGLHFCNNVRLSVSSPCVIVQKDLRMRQPTQQTAIQVFGPNNNNNNEKKDIDRPGKNGQSGCDEGNDEQQNMQLLNVFCYFGTRANAHTSTPLSTRFVEIFHSFQCDLDRIGWAASHIFISFVFVYSGQPPLICCSTFVSQFLLSAHIFGPIKMPCTHAATRFAFYSADCFNHYNPVLLLVLFFGSGFNY